MEDGAKVAIAVRRLRTLASSFPLDDGGCPSMLAIHFTSSESNGDETVITSVRIGDVSIKIQDPEHPELIPWKVAPLGSPISSVSQEVLAHLRWMIQKDRLEQDMFLIGPPGPTRRWLALRYCEVTRREVEFVGLSGDTTESDLKQRREIIEGSLYYINMPPVTAAVEGRILILEGIEKCERNVLPVLNNLLENREMTLEDGRMMTSAKRYDTLQKTHTAEEFAKLKLVRVHPAFRVIALGLPVPRFPGNNLDPPLRSRFQARDVSAFSVPVQYENLQAAAPNVPAELIRRLLSLGEALRAIEASGLMPNVPHFSETSLLTAIRVLNIFPLLFIPNVFDRIFPYYLLTDKGEQGAIALALARFGIQIEGGGHNIPQQQQQQQKEEQVRELIHSERAKDSGGAASDAPTMENYGRYHKAARQNYETLGLSKTPENGVCIEFRETEFSGSQESLLLKVAVEGGRGRCLARVDAFESGAERFVLIPFHRNLLVGMLQDHAAGVDMCIVGDKGMGKSAIVRFFGRALGYQRDVRVVHCYKDMTSRDLLQRRVTKENGDTQWEYSPLIQAALKGDICVLDGVHRLLGSSLAMIQSLITDRDICLFDGTRLVPPQRLEHMVEVLLEKEKKNNENDVNEAAVQEKIRRQLIERKVFAVHPAFRLVVLATPPTPKQPWLTSEIISLFHFHHLSHNDLSTNEKADILRGLFPRTPELIVDSLLKVDTMLAHTHQKSTPGGLPPGLSLRQLIRLCRISSVYPDELYEAIQRTLLARFLPMQSKEILDDLLEQASIKPSAQTDLINEGDKIEVLPDKDGEGGVVKVGNVVVQRRRPRMEGMVPHVLFYDIPLHVALLKRMLSDFDLGHHLLLIGNQGVGKNKLVDRMLELLAAEREYIQLHRDTTVQSLTSAPSLSSGVVIWKDSPLVSAIVHGRVLVVDEADKAPLEVVCILKGLVEDGEMFLSDGRRILAAAPEGDEDPIADAQNNIVRIHPDFRMIALANRPGFPFLGNDFFREIGDCFSCHAIDNPDTASELALLQGYGPNVPVETLRRLTLLFADLRKSVDEGLLTYPYSTRELVNIVKHMQMYADDSLLQTLENIFSFDVFDPQLREHLAQTFHRHGIPLGTSFHFSISIGKEVKLPPPMLEERWMLRTEYQPYLLSVNTFPVDVAKAKWGWSRPPQFELKGRVEGRIQSFTEERYSFTVPSDGKVLDMASLPDNSLYILINHPFSLYCFNPTHDSYTVIPLGENMPFYSPSAHTPSLWALPASNRLVVYLPSHKILLLVDPVANTATPLSIPLIWDEKNGEAANRRFSLFGNKLYLAFPGNTGQPSSRMLSTNMVLVDTLVRYEDPATGQSEEILVFYQKGGNLIVSMNLSTGTAQMIRPFTRPNSQSNPDELEIKDMFLPSKNEWIIQDVKDNYHLAQWRIGKLPTERDSHVQPYLTVYPIIRLPRSLVNLPPTSRSSSSKPVLPDYDYMSPITASHVIHLSASGEHQSNAAANPSVFSYFMESGSGFQRLVEPMDDTQGEELPVYSFPRPDPEETNTRVTNLHSLYLRRSNQMLTLTRTQPFKARTRSEEEVDPARHMELLNFEAKTVRVIHLNVDKDAGKEKEKERETSGRGTGSGKPSTPSSSLRSLIRQENRSAYMREVGYLRANHIVKIIELGSGDVAVLYEDGIVHVYEVDPSTLQVSLERWQNIVGAAKEQQSQLDISYEGSNKKPEGPKHGKEDGKEHHGGNTFAGGTGGRDTAGLGGKAGPYRLDSGHPIYQLEQAEKDAVDRDIRLAAREMAKKALAEKLKEISMDEHEDHVYRSYYDAVRQQIAQLRVILQGVEAKAKERQWLKLKTSGDLDDLRLIEGITGEKNIYKKRGEEAPKPGGPHNLPKRLRFVLDVSASMYRFNKQDRRLERLLECVVLVMESLVGFEHKYSYSIVGHSGDGPEIPFVDYGKPPSNNKERLQILKMMRAHSEYCASGDFTLEAAELAVENVRKEPADDYFVFVVSDANLGRYGLNPSKFSKVMTKDEDVNCNVIFIASVEDEAERLKMELPVGKSYVCLDTAKLPTTFKQIFTTNITF